MASSSGSTNRAGRTGEGRGGSGGAEGGDGERPNREEMRRRFESMTPEQREEFRARRRERGEGGGGGGGGGFGRRDGGEVSLTRKVYIVDTSKGDSPKNLPLKAVTITTGITDGVYTEVKDGLNEGDVIVTGLNIKTPTAQTSQNAPMGRSPFGGGGGPGGGGFRPR